MLEEKISHQLHTDLTPTSTHFFIVTLQRKNIRSDKEVTIMFLGMEWYWWFLILVALAICIPFKVKFMKWWSQRQQEKKKEQHRKWGDDE